MSSGCVVVAPDEEIVFLLQAARDRSKTIVRITARSLLFICILLFLAVGDSRSYLIMFQNFKNGTPF
jgi:hypothetical protein